MRKLALILGTMLGYRIARRTVALWHDWRFDRIVAPEAERAAFTSITTAEWLALDEWLAQEGNGDE